MIIYSKGDIKDPIPESEVIVIGRKLKEFVEKYRKLVYIGKDEDYDRILNVLDDISHKMLTGRYNEVFDDPRIVDILDNSVPF